MRFGFSPASHQCAAVNKQGGMAAYFFQLPNLFIGENILPADGGLAAACYRGFQVGSVAAIVKSLADPRGAPDWRAPAGQIFEIFPYRCSLHK